MQNSSKVWKQFYKADEIEKRQKTASPIYGLILAAHVMYECGMRLGIEVFNLDGLKKQAKCYLACINALKLVSCIVLKYVKANSMPLPSIASTIIT